jgi:BirA family biotin operon repressor/biotin-[acetyl-CoA-carboxylase] ligase
VEFILKNGILDTLKQHNEYVSGEELSKIFNVSRTAIWKHINELRKDGYTIESSSKKGYKLMTTPDLLDKREIKIPEGQLLGCEIIHFDEIDSTNNYAKRIANEGCQHGTVVIAEKQLIGRGRVGREWKSNNSEGLWFSIILRPALEPEEVQLITLAASVAVVEAIQETQGIVCGIKWPNDIILNNCKLGGILTELSAELGHINYIVVGIGINVNQDLDKFDDEIKKIATSLKIHLHRQVSRVEILSGILTKFEKIYNFLINGDTHAIIDRWSRLSVTIGKEVKIIIKNIEYYGLAQSITSDGKLIVKCNDGETREISAGEIQIRGLLGYT